MEVSMKTIGLIGGVTWESTVTYYEIMNRVVAEKLGGYHSAKCLMYSVDFGEIEALQSRGDWDGVAALMSDASKKLERGGADFIVISANTMHKVADSVQAAISVPVFHVVDVTARELKSSGFDKAVLLGTKYTMEQDFYKAKLIDRGIRVMVPEEEDRERINDIIYNELCLGIVSGDSKQKLLRVIEEVTGKGAQGVILGCTEIGLLINQNDTKTPLYDTTLIHGRRAALHAIGQ
jgi:aspartate racemase